MNRTLLIVSLFTALTACAQLPLEDVRAIEGPWEVTSASGIDGFFVSVSSFLDDRSGQLRINSQNIDIRVYQRKQGVERKGYFVPGDSGSASVSVDGQHLTLRFNRHTEIGPLDIDLRFDSASRRWTGIWKDDGASREVTLERPQITSSKASVFVGDWSGETSRFAPTKLHIRQSSDGQFVVWLDRSLSAFNPSRNLRTTDQRNGELLNVDSVLGSTLRIRTASPMGNNYVFEGSVSEDGKAIRGEWTSPSGGGGRLNAATNFTRSE
jgi:hypothetical protein